MPCKIFQQTFLLAEVFHENFIFIVFEENAISILIKDIFRAAEKSPPPLPHSAALGE
jgi:hypothetical protein